MAKILYAASTVSHINSFHRAYIAALRDLGNEVLVMARGDEADFNIPFEKRIFSRKNGKCRRMIKGILKDEGFDAIILNTSLAAFHIRLSLPRKRPIVVNVAHGYLFSEKPPEKGLRGAIKNSMLRIAEKMLCGVTDRVITMNDEDYRLAKRHKLCRGDVVNCLGMGVTRKETSEEPSSLRARLGDTDSFVLAFVGELSPRKNQRFLIEALPKIRVDIPNAVLWLVGEGEERESLVTLSSELGVLEYVRFIGQSSAPGDYMKASDVYVSAARSEGLPFNVVEALGQGKFTVLSDVKGHRDIITAGVGALFSQDDEAEFCRIVKDFHSGVIAADKKEIDKTFERFSFDRVFSDTLGKMRDGVGV